MASSSLLGAQNSGGQASALWGPETDGLVGRQRDVGEVTKAGVPCPLPVSAPLATACGPSGTLPGCEELRIHSHLPLSQTRTITSSLVTLPSRPVRIMAFSLGPLCPWGGSRAFYTCHMGLGYCSGTPRSQRAGQSCPVALCIAAAFSRAQCFLAQWP